VVVSYADLNMSSSTGQAAFKARVRHAAQTVCGDQPDNRNPGAVRDYKVCVAKSVSAATSAAPIATVMAGATAHNG
jgi:UrcA family protein